MVSIFTMQIYLMVGRSCGGERHVGWLGGDSVALEIWWSGGGFGNLGWALGDAAAGPLGGRIRYFYRFWVVYG
jgi:hypothetical protein